MNIITNAYLLTVSSLINVILASWVNDVRDNTDDSEPVIFGRRLRVPISKERCTRRFAPGRCMDTVTSVWTFVAQMQNCTERQGCRIPTRTNRFPSYHRCMRNCRSLLLSDAVLYNKTATDEPHETDDTHESDEPHGTDEPQGTDGAHGTDGTHGIETIARLEAANSSNPRREGIYQQPNLFEDLDWHKTQHERAWYYKNLVNSDDQIGDEGAEAGGDYGDDDDDDDDGPLVPGRDAEELEEREEMRPLHIDEFNDYV